MPSPEYFANFAAMNPPGIRIIEKYFPGLKPDQRRRFSEMGELYTLWNEKINVISRKDIGHLYERHILHSLGIAMAVSFPPGTKILDAGTGGGFPGIPLAVMFPECNFCLLDATAKKIRVVNEVAASLGLKNITAVHGRLEEFHEQFDFVVSRALTDIRTMLGWTLKNVRPGQSDGIDHGILYLKGGDFSEELIKTGSPHHSYDLSEFFEEEYFQTKKLLHIIVT